MTALKKSILRLPWRLREYVAYINLYQDLHSFQGPTYSDFIARREERQGMLDPPLERLHGARHIFLLKDSIVGYATMLGDDTFPHLTEWRTGVTVLLCPALYSNCAHLLFGDIHVRLSFKCENKLLTRICFRASAIACGFGATTSLSF